MLSWVVMFRQQEGWMWKLAFQGEYNIHLYGRVLVKNLIPSEYGYISMRWILKLGENNLAEQSRLNRCVAFTMLNLYQVNSHYVVGMNTYVCRWGSKHGWFVWMVGSTDAANWIANAPTKNNAEDTMKARLFLLCFEHHNIWLQHLHIILFLFKY
jgi:hypothetical protein